MEIRGGTRVLGVIGNPIEHSISPILHNIISDKLHKDIVYVPFKVFENDLQKAVEGLKALNCVGFNVTVPHKTNIIEYLDECDPEAEVFGAINTVHIQNGKLIGYNTDTLGFYRSLEGHSGSASEKSVLLIGAGGAARALGIYLAQQGSKEIFIMNRSLEKAEKLKAEIESITVASVQVLELGMSCKPDIVIQATSVGMHPNIQDSPVDLKEILCEANHKPDVYDIIYNPIETQFLKQARELGCKTINGFEMLMYQGILAYERWLSISIDSELANCIIEEVKQKYYGEK